MLRDVLRKDPLPGQEVLGRYTIVGRLGSGGVCDVYLARQKSLQNRNVAVKLLKRVICTSRTKDAAVHRGRFQREAEIMAMLRSTSFARILDQGSIQDDVERPFIVQEYLAGVLLASHLKSGQHFSPSVAVRATLLLADALHELHLYDIVYCDLAPANIILEEGGAYEFLPRLFDFSHVRLPDEQRRHTRSDPGLLAGTPPFAAPELSSGRADPRSDVFSLAAVLYTMLSGQPPLSLSSADWPTYLDALSSNTLPAVPLRALDDPLLGRIDKPIARALSRQPEDRQTNVPEFLADLYQAISGPSGLLPPFRSNGFVSSVLARLRLK